jgi:predicted TIM-barrel fold metal-dependent hydrolase
MRVIDSHFHVWRQADLPWLSGPMQPRIFGPYEPIRRDYPMSEYLADVAGQGVEKSVYVQANWAPDAAEAEAEWIERVALETGWPHAIVAYADMTVPDARPALRPPRPLPARARHPPAASLARKRPIPLRPRPDLAADPTVQKNVSHLADYGWTFDLQVFAGQMESACALVDACPGVDLRASACRHAGRSFGSRSRNLAPGDGRPRRPAQRLCQAFGLRNLRPPQRRGTDRWLWSETVALFGADRCLWGSNFPIEKLWTDYASLLDAHRSAAAALGESEQQAIFHDTARRVYRL